MHLAYQVHHAWGCALNFPTASSLEYLATRYPPSLNVKQVGEITSGSVDAIRNALSRGCYPIPSFKIGRKRVFRLIDVAVYIDQQYAVANPHSKSRSDTAKSASRARPKAQRGR